MIDDKSGIQWNSEDPRVQRLGTFFADFHPLQQPEEWVTYEVFHQRRRGEQHVHVGSVHAPDPELALVFAKEQFARRQHCSSLWVVPSSQIHISGYENEDMFSTTPDKTYREASGYRLRHKISSYKQAQLHESDR
ncbi:MAG: hypothetical protein RMK52_03340 [Chitinophagales bacterium]|nr:hypothetical protein [Chitinophagales bacterium]MDW8393260.1 hypothetical protein [Chitinophagales bacterium]